MSIVVTRTAGAIVAIGLLAAAPLSAREKSADTESTAYQINASHSGGTTFGSGFSAPLQQLWKTKFDGFTSYPVIADHKVFVVAQNAKTLNLKLYSLDAADGSVLWSASVDGELWATPTYDNGKVFVDNSKGEVEAFDSSSGNRLWSADLKLNSSSPPNAFGGKVYVNGHDGFTERGDLFALDEETGSIAWSFKFLWASQDSPAFGDDAVFSCAAHRLSATTGFPRWHYTGGCTDPGAASTYFNNRLYVRGNGPMTELDAATGRFVRSFPGSTPPAFFQSRSGKTLGVVLSGSTLSCFSEKNGRVRWSFDGDGQLSAPPIAINDKVIAGSWTGKLYVLDGNTGSVDWATNVGSPIRNSDEWNQEWPLSGMAAADGILAVSASDRVVAFAPQ